MEILGSIVAKIAEYTVAPIGRQMGYIFSYKDNLQRLADQLVELEGTRDTIKHWVNDERRNGKQIEVVVQKWLDKVDEITEKAKKLCDDPHHEKVRGSKCSFPNLWQRHQLSRKAKVMANNVTDVQDRGKFDRDKIGYVPAIGGVGSTSATSCFINFESRISIMNEMMQALIDPKVSILGIYGFGGLGKSTLVEHVAGKAKHDNLFDEVVMASVTQTPDLKRIQGEIADQLGLQFLEETVAGRAYRLRERINKEKNILIILDDIWERMKLEEIGIPYRGIINMEKSEMLSQDDQVGCKVLLTSRSQDVLYEMETRKNFRLEFLSEKEAWTLFEVMAGNIVKDRTYEGIASEVAKKCAGLPVLIVTVARALKNKDKPVWKDALSQLARVDNKELHEITYSALELSYNHLESDEVKELFLLCGVLGPRVSVEDLLKYVMGLDMFKHIITLEDARNRLHKIISALKASCLLLEDEINAKFVKMHEVVHGVAITIASRDDYVFMRKPNFDLTEWPTDVFLKRCSKIILYQCNIQTLPERLDSPELEFFCLNMANNRSLEIPDSFFKGMRKLKALKLACMNISSIPTSVHYLTELQTLCLDRCVLGDIAIIGALKNLKVLSLMYSSMVELPSELGQLTNLRMLDIKNSKIGHIPPNIISSLTALEELYMGSASIEWEVGNSANQSKNASLAELRQLPNLNVLEVKIGEVWNLPRDLMFDKLERFQILIGDVWKWTDSNGTSKTLKLKLPTSIHLEHGIKVLTKRVESLSLDEIEGISNVLYQLNGEGFPLLKHLHIQNNNQIQLIINPIEWIQVYDSFPNLETMVLHNLNKLEKLCHGPLSVNSLSKLKVIKIKSCHQLKYLVSYSMVKRLSQLIDIEVSECNSMQEVVFMENGNIADDDITDTIEFCRLRSLSLQKLPTLDGFFSNDNRLAATHISNPFFKSKVALPCLETLKFSSINLHKIWDDDKLSDNCAIQNLTTLIIEDCGDLKHLFSYSMIGSLSKLKQLEISKCQMMEEIIDTEGRRNIGLPSKEVQFPSLEKIVINNMKKLRTVWHCQFDGLKSMVIGNCEKLVCIFPSYMQQSFHSLETLTVRNCGSVKKIFELDANETSCAEDMTELRKLTLVGLPELKQIWSMEAEEIVSFHNLQAVHVESCHNLEYLFPLSIATRLPKIEVLEVLFCPFMKTIVEKKEEMEGTARFVLNQLTSLYLSGIHHLRGFYAGNYTLSCPSLKQIYVFRCENLMLLMTQSINYQEEHDVGKLGISLRQPLSIVQEVIPNLEQLTLDSKCASKILQDEFPSLLIRKLKLLGLSEFEGECGDFPDWFLRNVPNLEDLVVQHSAFKEIFQDKVCSVEEGRVQSSTRVKSLSLFSLPKLQHICKEGFQIDPVLEVLETLRVKSCSSLINLVPSSVIFSFLTFLEVRNCNGLIKLITSRTARSLVKLETIKIEECNLLEEIVTEQEDEVKDGIAFISLKILELICLPKLNKFCSSKCFIKFPLLWKVVVRQCPRMEIFSLGDTSTPNLCKVQVNDEEGCWEGNINGTIEKMFTDKVAFRSFEHLNLTEFPELKDLWYGPSVHNLFLSLKSLVVHKCDFLSDVLFTSNLLQVLQNLEELEVKECDSIEAVFDVKGMDDKEGLVKQTAQIKKLTLSGLPKLKRIWNKDPQEIIMIGSLSKLKQLEISKCHMMEEIVDTEGGRNNGLPSKWVQFPSLEKIVINDMKRLRNVWHCQFDGLKSMLIDNCEKLVCIFPSYMQQNFHSLETLTVRNCGSVKEIFELDANKKSCAEDMTELRKLTLVGLPKLKQIWSMEPEGIVSFNNLQVVRVKSCDNLEYLFPLSVATRLAKIEVLEVLFCPFMKTIVEKNEEMEGTASFVLNQLTSLDLRGMRHLWGFYAGNYTLSCPSLKRINVFRCENLTLFMTQSINHQEVHHVGKLGVSLRQPLLIVQEVIPNLEKLSLDRKCASMILQHEFPSLLVDKLKILRVSEFEDEHGNFPDWFLRDVPSLEILVVEHSAFKEVFQDKIYAVEEGWIQSSTRVKSLSLFSLPKLQHICKEGFQIDPVLEVLETLRVKSCSSLINLVPSSVTFSFLTFLEVRNCNGLIKLITSTTARSLVKLETIKIEECNLLEEIVTEQEDEVKDGIAFISLKILELICLPKLNKFCSSKCFIKFPLLWKVVVRQCPRMEIFSLGDPSTPNLCKVQVNDEEGCWEGNINGTTQKMFGDKVAFRSFKRLNLTEFPELKDLWYGPSRHNMFQSLKSLVVHKCDFLSDVLFTSNLLQLLQNLEDLEVKDCDSVEAVFDVESMDDKEGLMKQTAQMKKLTLSGLPKLKHIWNKDPQEIISFRNLRSVQVTDCKKLEYLFSFSLCQDLEHLEKLDIKSCGVVEIVSKKEGCEKCRFHFPHLTIMRLWNLSKLKSFYPGNHTLECPSLKDLNVNHCEALQTFDFHCSDFLQLHQMDRVDIPIQQALFSFEKVCTRLEKLALNSKDMMAIQNGQHLEDIFDKIEVLRLHCFHETPAIFPIDFLQRISNPIKLKVRCSSFHSIFPREGVGRRHSGTSVQVEELWLVNLEKLVYIWNEDNQSDTMVHLKSSEVNLPPSLFSFKNLIRLYVKDCKALLYLITSSMAKSLVQLRRVTIVECETLQYVMKIDEEVAEEEITFANLKYLELSSLPSFRGFCSGKCTLIFPSLLQLKVRGCPRMKIFSPGVMITPMLRVVEVEDGRKCWDGDLDTTIKQLFEDKVAFHSFKLLNLTEFPELKDLWYGPSMHNMFQSLKSLVVHKCDFLSDVLFTSNLLQLLQNLEDLEVKDCDSVEAVFDVESLDDKEGLMKQTTQMKKLTLSGLPKLKHIWNKDPQEIISFRNLRSVQVTDCKRLEYLFSFSLCQDLEHLEKLDIKSCGVVEIVSKKEGCEKCRFHFPYLTIMRLWNLSKLKSFYPGNHTLECPSLKDLNVKHCEALQTFDFHCSDFLQLHQMDRVDILVQQALFSFEKVCTRLEKLALNSKDMMAIQNGQHLEDIFDKIEVLRLHCFHETPAIFPIDFLQRISNPIKLKVRCSSFHSIFPREGVGRRHSGTSVQVEELWLVNLEKLVYIWNEDNQSDTMVHLKSSEVNLPPSLFSFKNLIRLYVKDCKALLYLITSSMAKSLVQLRRVTIVECETLQYVMKIDEEVAEEEITFANLEYLELSSLPSFRGFCSGKCTLIFPSLLKLKVRGCPRMKIFSPGVMITPMLRVVEVEDGRKCWDGDLDTTIKQLFVDKVVPNLEKLQLDSKDVMTIWQGQYPEDLFHNIKTLNLECFHEQSAFPSHLLERFHRLEKLEVSQSSFEIIFPWEGENDHYSKMPTHINQLRFEHLSQLKYIWNQDSQLDSLVRNLKSLEVVCCSNLEKLAPTSLSFQNLTTLMVDQCDGLVNLVTSSMAKSFVQLITMRIQNCKMMEEIVGEEGDEEGDEIAFNCLALLELSNLDSLKSFCSRNDTFKFPSLTRITVKDCPKMDIFCPGVLVTPMLEAVESEDRNTWENNLNTTIKHMFMHKDIPQVDCHEILKICEE